MEQFLHTVIQEAGDLALSYYYRGFTVSQKSNRYDLLTEADVATNGFIRTRIQERFPDHAITTEEEPYVAGTSEYEWLVDPIDGTYNFAHKHPIWATMICLLRNGETILSAIYFPVSKQLFYANETGTYIDGKKATVPPAGCSLAEATGRTFASSTETKESYTRYRKALQYIAGLPHTGFRNNSASCELVYMLNGYVQYAFANSGFDYDYLPPFYILRQAGAIITNSSGGPCERGKEDFIAASDEALHKELLAVFNR